ncbi:YsaB family lipoprotein [Citrobacter koseri]|uniref:YsaB family lipoprotein n=1 Tax=Citrobacter koseri TaxID=545 RepID=UPI001D2ADE33|nr:YsaB family lipoprotein [uncultured Citrobacter sp.]EKW5654646.1 YsaB family lipoprotein [Citrobacter koseri]EKY0737923.1 YsaB family lipoprotein [Citrobacter koseri]HEM8689191.1 YsaB family lipoprotein [Citrobacter koseri]
MMMKSVFPVLLTLLLVGCATTAQSVQKAQKVNVNPERSLDMEALCKAQAARRYNTGTQKIDVTGFEQYQGSYEMRGNTFRKESFVCSFDAEGQFLHLSMR